MAENPSNIVPDQIILLEGGGKLVPAPSAGDSGKVLGVLNSNGDIGWTEDREGVAQQQADWAETDSSKVTFIANKPSGQMAPASTTSDSGKVLKVNAQGAPVWGDAPAGTAEFVWSTVTKADVESAIAAGKLVVITDDTFSGESVKCYLEEVQTSSSGADYYFTSQTHPGAMDAFTQNATIIRLSINPAGVKLRETRSVGLKLVSEDSSVSIANGTIPGQLNITTNAVPTSAQADANKVLTVNSSGKPVWGSISIPSVDQTYNASSTNAQSGTAVAGALANINQVPASTSADADKVLTVNSSGTPEWATAQGGGGGVTPPTPTAENFGFTYASIQGFGQVITDWAPTSLTFFKPFVDATTGEYISGEYSNWYNYGMLPNWLRQMLSAVSTANHFWGQMYNSSWGEGVDNPWPMVGNRFSADVTLKFPLSIDTSVFTTAMDIRCNITARGADPMGMGSGPEIIIYDAYPRFKIARGESGYQYFFHHMHIPLCVNNRPISEMGNVTYDLEVPQGTTLSVPAKSQFSQEDLNDFGIYVTLRPETMFREFV